MGCQCNKKAEEEELNKESPPNLKEEADNNQLDNGANLTNQDQLNTNKNFNTNPQNEQEDEDYLEKLNEEKNVKYAEYPDKMLELINKIRENPVAYADVIEDSIKYIIEVPDKEDETKNRLVFKKKVKVALNRGESAFHEAAEILRKMEPMAPLEFNGNICIPLPQDEEELRDPNYLKEQVKAVKENYNIDLFFKDLVKLPEVSALLMVVDDSVKNSGRKRQAILNKDFKYIGINSHFVGKTFLAYFAFSK
mgnify:CR=1 FL=1|jgi:hypothetical protein